MARSSGKYAVKPICQPKLKLPGIAPRILVITREKKLEMANRPIKTEASRSANTNRARVSGFPKTKACGKGRKKCRPIEKCRAIVFDRIHCQWFACFFVAFLRWSITFWWHGTFLSLTHPLNPQAIHIMVGILMLSREWNVNNRKWR